jgi:plasmid maintenance system antidote protein VapI
MTAQMHNPPHLGEILRSLCLEPLGLSVQYDPWRAEKRRKSLRVSRIAA